MGNDASFGELEKVCKPIDLGGLGFESFMWWTRPFWWSSYGALGWRVIVAKYGYDLLGCSNCMPVKSVGSSWRSIFKINKEFQQLRGFRVGRGIGFYFGIMCSVGLWLWNKGSQTSSDRPMVEEHVVRMGGSRLWKLHLRRALNDWEVPTVSCLMARLDWAQIVDPNSEDSMYWPFDLEGKYSIKFICPCWGISPEAFSVHLEI